jgi:hypothetical protein
MQSQIRNIFKIRDRAITQKDPELFLSTQINEIQGSGVEGYMKTDRLKTIVLHAHHDDKDSNLWIALVQEDYFYEGQFSHRIHLLYKLLEKDKKLLIYDIKW